MLDLIEKLDDKRFRVSVAYDEIDNQIYAWIDTVKCYNTHKHFECVYMLVMKPSGLVIKHRFRPNTEVPIAVFDLLLNINDDPAFQLMRMVLTGEDK